MSQFKRADFWASALALTVLLLGLGGCSSIGRKTANTDDKVATAEAAHGGAANLRRFFDTRPETVVRSELSKFGIGFKVHPTLAPAVASVTECLKFFPESDRAKWHSFNGEYYYIDDAGRPSRAYADLPPIRTEARINSCQTLIGTWGDEENPNDDYDGGHLIGSQLGGWGGRANIVPQNSNFNRGNWSQLENKMATCSVLDAAFMRYSIEVEYANQATLIPSAFSMTITRQQDGLAITLRFENVRGGGSEGTVERRRGTDFLTESGCIEPPK